MESAEAPADDLHAKVGKELEELGHPAQTVPPHEQPVLKENIGLPDIDVVPEGVYKLVHGEEPQTFVGSTKGENWRTRLKRRISEKLKWK